MIACLWKKLSLGDLYFLICCVLGNLGRHAIKSNCCLNQRKPLHASNICFWLVLFNGTGRGGPATNKRLSSSTHNTFSSSNINGQPVDLMACESQQMHFFANFLSFAIFTFRLFGHVIAFLTIQTIFFLRQNASNTHQTYDISISNMAMPQKKVSINLWTTIFPLSSVYRFSVMILLSERYLAVFQFGVPLLISNQVISYKDDRRVQRSRLYCRN